MKKKISNTVFLVIMTLSGFILLPVEVLLLFFIIMYLPFEWFLYRIKYKVLFSKYSFLFTIRYKNVIKCYKYLINKNPNIKIHYNEEGKFLLVDNDVVIFKKCLKCENTDLKYLSIEFTKKYNIIIDNIVDYKLMMK